MQRYTLQPSAEGKPLSLTLETTDTPDPKPNEVVVRIKACSLNYRDLLVRSGFSASGGDDTCIPLSDGAGEIVSIGTNVTRWKEGDRVMPTFFQDWIDGPFDMKYHQAARGGSCDGVLAEYIVIPDHSAVEIPDYLSFEEAACLPCAAVTAWQALFERGDPFEKSDSLLCLGTGGVSIFALQIAHAMNRKVYITSSSDEKLEKAKTLGADELINYKTQPDWDKEIYTRTDKNGVNQVIEVGGPGTLEKSMNALAANGTLSLIGVLTGFDASPASLFPMVARSINLHGIYVGSREMFERMNQYFISHQIRPQIDRVFDFGEAAAAYEHLESAQHLGKIVIKAP